MNRSPFLIDKAFEQRLSDENSGTESSDSGWTIVRLDSAEEIVVEKKGLRLWVAPDDLSAVKIKVGEVGAIRLGKEMRRMAPGFYLLLGNKNLETNSDLVRIYWNVTDKGAPVIVRHVTEILNRCQVPFRFKVVNLPRHFDRTDAAVLYMNRVDFLDRRAEIARIHAQTRRYMKAETSAFAKTLAHGLALAEDHGHDTSFGQDVSKLFADGLFNVFNKEKHSREEKAEEILSYLEAQNVDAARLYLRPGSRDTYSQLHGVFD